MPSIENQFNARYIKSKGFNVNIYLNNPEILMAQFEAPVPGFFPGYSKPKTDETESNLKPISDESGSHVV